jgi:hypothetical protein
MPPLCGRAVTTTTTLVAGGPCAEHQIPTGAPCGNCGGRGECRGQCQDSTTVCVDLGTKVYVGCLANSACPAATPICAGDVTCGSTTVSCYTPCPE